jgi:hypothetical protein
MSDPKAELHTRIEDVDAVLERFERQAVAIIACTLMLSLVSYTILLQMIL